MVRSLCWFFLTECFLGLFDSVIFFFMAGFLSALRVRRSSGAYRIPRKPAFSFHLEPIHFRLTACTVVDDAHLTTPLLSIRKLLADRSLLTGRQKFEPDLT